MTYTRRALAIKTAKARSKSLVPTSDKGHCLREVRECLAITAKAPTAYAAWVAAKHRHTPSPKQTLQEFIKDIPRGAPVFWRGGSEGAGHVALPTGYGSKCYSTDILRAGYFDKVPIGLISAKWPALVLLGWAEDLNGVTVYP